MLKLLMKIYWYTLLRISILFFMVLCHARSSHAITNSIYTIEQLKNLPQNDVNCIFRDSKGFMWIGTLDGLHRFDGYAYKTFRISEDSSGISSNLVIDIAEDSKGNIWIATYAKGICRLDPVTESFINYNTFARSEYRLPTDDVTCMMIDEKDVLWFGNWLGFYRLQINEDASLNSVMPYLYEGTFNTNSDIETKKIHQDENGNIWIGTNYNIFKINNPYGKKEGITFQEFITRTYTIIDYEDGILLGGDSISAIQQDRNGNYVHSKISDLSSNSLLYRNQVIWSGNRAGVACLKYTPSSGWKTSLEFNKENTNNQIKSNIVTSLYEDEIGQIWLGTRAGGINIINTNPKRFMHFYHTTGKGSIGSNFVQCIFEDHNRNLWIGTEDEGVSLLRRPNETNYSNKFISHSINTFENEDRVYFIEETMTPKSERYASVLWLGTSFPANLAAINPETLEFIQQPDIINQIGFVFALESQNDSILWAGTYGNGLWRFTLNDHGQISGYQNFTPKDNSETTISSYIIRNIFYDRNGNLWIGTDKGLNRISQSELKKQQPRFETFTKGLSDNYLSNDYILQIYQSINGTIWFGTMGGGLIGFSENEDSGEYRFFTINDTDGLPNNVIKSILEDERGFLWLSSNKGLSRFNPFTGEIVNYDVEDGLQENEFSEICAFKRANGQLVFGGINGITVFYPNQIVKDTTKPKLFFTDFYILNKLVQPNKEHNGRIVLDKSIEYTNKIKLKYNQNSFSFGFVGLHFNAPQKNSYRYILEGFDQEWTNTGAEYRIAKYTNVPPGDYIFKVIGSNCDNIWAAQPISMEVKVFQPAYSSKFAYSIYVILLTLIAYIVYRIVRLTALRKKEVLIAELEKKNVEEISQMKLRFFTNISHEFRTPLTLISTPLEKLITRDHELAPEQRQTNYKLIKQNANLMLRLINQLMDFRRMEQDKMKLRLEIKEINQFVSDICKSFEPWSEQKNISFNFNGSDRNELLWIDLDKIEKVVYNLLSNAFKFTPKDGLIRVKIESKTNNTIAIVVSDSGIGIDKDEQQHIFERYYQPDKKNKQMIGGTGIGLALSKGLIDLHQGQISVESQKDAGTIFKVTLNKGEQWFTEDAAIKKVKAEIPVNSGQPDTEIHLTKDLEHEPVLPPHQYKVLLVEDNIELRKIVADIFINDFIVLEADDGAEGLEKCIKEFPDIVISDIMMPNMNGIELCDSIKKDEQVSHIPVLLLTAKDTYESQIEGFESGADAYIPKPFNTDVLKARVVSLIRNREALRQKFQKEIEINPMIIANSPADSKFLDQILAIIEKNLSDSEFSVEKLAEEYGVSRIYLNRKIKALTGETSNQFLRNIRLKHAAELLKQNVLTVSEVTWEVGYNDLRTFRTRFKEKFGVSPSEYAKNEGNVNPPIENLE